MTNSINEKVSTHLNLVKLISSAVLVSGLLLTAKVSAEELNANQFVSEDITFAEDQKPLIDWTRKVSASLNQKMERKIENIIIQAEYSRSLDNKTRNMLASIDTK